MYRIMIVLVAGHSGANTGAVGVNTALYGRLDEGAETIWLRNRVAQLLVERWNCFVLFDEDKDKLAVVIQKIKSVVKENDVCIELHFNSAKNAEACGTEVILSDNPTDVEVRIGVQLLNATAKALGTDIRSIKTEKQTPHRTLAFTHLPCNSVILEVCFCSNYSDSEIYFRNRELLAASLAKQIALISKQLTE